jgi:hypothetical protein
MKAISMRAAAPKQLDPGRRSYESRDFESGLRWKIVGQDEAVQAVVDLYQVFCAVLREDCGNTIQEMRQAIADADFTRLGGFARSS